MIHLCGLPNLHAVEGAPHGWLLGKLTERFTPQTPRLYAKFNVRIRWIDGWENHNLLLDNYLQGPNAPVYAWVVVDKDALTHRRSQ